MEIQLDTVKEQLAEAEERITGLLFADVNKQREDQKVMEKGKSFKEILNDHKIRLSSVH